MVRPEDHGRLRIGPQRVVPLSALAAQRHQLRIQSVFLYAWLTHESRANPFGFSGLRRVRHGKIVSTSALTAFRSVARKLDGCAKPLGDAARCR